MKYRYLTGSMKYRYISGSELHRLLNLIYCCFPNYIWSTVCRGSAQLIALVCVKPAYPALAPIFSLSLHWGEGEKNPATSEWIRSGYLTVVSLCIPVDQKLS